ncbi:tetratricopeptide repeat protein [Xanthobacter autotrophicus DSM 431]|uniref:tetratricopeptide repeat protein n=1 Tax=Xanthobacter nonsaccharivorans TaxID=3119912 RepID=UPI0037265A71
MVEIVPEARGDAAPEADAPLPLADAAAAEAERARQIRAALERVLASPDFSASPRLAAFLRFVVEATLEGRAEEIKGYTIAVEALGRPASFDPQADPIVRVEATRLRRALERYYSTQGTADPVVIDIPKGGYVPLFLPRGEGTAEDTAADEAAPPSPQGEEAAVPVPAVLPPARHFPWRGVAGAVLAVVVAGAALFGLPFEGQKVPQREIFIADAIRLPIVEVRPIEAAGTASLPAGELKAIEERMRDAFARFDFVDVKAAGVSTPESVVAEACNGPQSRSVFSLAALAEGRSDSSFSLVVRLTDRCDGSIVWSAALDGLQQGPGIADSERRVVHEIAAAIMETYGVIPVRARAQALAKAPGSGFGCVAGALSMLRQEAQQAQRAAAAQACLADLAKRNPDFALGHAVAAMTTLYTLMREGTYAAASDEVVEGVLDLAERAVDLAPASAYAARTLALVQMFAGEPEEALATAQKALELNPLDFDVAAMVASVYIGAGKVDEGEALLQKARREGAVRTPLQDAFLGFAAFLREDMAAAQALVPQLALHPGFENKLALALTLHALGRTAEEHEAVANLVRHLPDGAQGVRQMVRRLIPSEPHAQKALAALEAAGLSREAIAGKPPRG